MKNRVVIFFLLIVFSKQLVAQKEANTWYFGNGAGLNFNAGYPVPLTDGKLYTNEGCATISDNKGHLLFYTDGILVWDKNHRVMPNGSGLGGSPTSTQSALIIRKPGSSNLYYVFTVFNQAGPKGLTYSVVDMTLNGKNGDVTIKNEPLLTPVSEKLTAVVHSNGIDVWIITHQWNTNAFYVYLLTSKGISSPVISNIGVVHKNMGSANNGESIGYLKSSPDGKKLASAISYIPLNDVEVVDFNPSKGTISNVRKIPTKGNAYGVSFSPDNSKLYISFQSGTDGVMQYDLMSEEKSGIKVSSGNHSYYGALQIGPDGKIYVATVGQYLDVINNPNEKGKECGYKSNALNLSGKNCAYGLPDFVESYFNQSEKKIAKLNLGNDTTVCSDHLTLNAGDGWKSYVWSTGDKTPQINVSSTGKYWVKANNGITTLYDTINVIFSNLKISVNLGRDTTVCSEPLTIDAGNAGASYQWSTGAITQKITVINSGTYRVNVTKEGCSVTASINVKFTGKPSVFMALQEFTPNGDGFNDAFDFSINDVTDFDLKIVDRKGKLIYETTDVKKKWDGKYKNKNADNGVYFWEVTYNSKCPGSKTISKKGEVTLSR